MCGQSAVPYTLYTVYDLSPVYMLGCHGHGVCCSLQVTAMCVRVNYASGPRTHSRSHLFSPPPPHSSTPSLTNKSPITSLDTQGSHDASPSHVTSGRSPVLPCVSEENGATDKQTRDSGITTFDPSRIHSNERKISHDRGRRSFSSNYSADEPRLKSPRFSMEPVS